MSYKITVTRTQEVTRTVGKEWKPVSQEIKQSDDRMGNVISHVGDVYGYTPAVEKTVTEERQVYEQIVDDLNLVAVIQAINGAWA